MPHAALPRIDIQLLVKNIGGSDRILPQLFELFWRSCEDCFSRMEMAITTKNLKEWEAASHELKGAALNVTARYIASICQEAENLAELETDEARVLLYELSKEIAILRKEMKALGW